MARSIRPSRLARLWHDYNLSVVVGAMFVASFVLHAIFGWWQYVADQASAGSPATFWGPDGFVVYFGEWTFQNWQSEFLEVFVLIVLTSFLIHKGSHESKDSQDRLEAKIDRIEQKLDRLAADSGRRLRKTG
jgi:succinate dehydrogenase hydrophobic anchor subunit